MGINALRLICRSANEVPVPSQKVPASYGNGRPRTVGAAPPANPRPTSAATELYAPGQQPASLVQLIAADALSTEPMLDNTETAPFLGGVLGPLPDIPGYEVLRFVAQGGMGVVLEARHRILDRSVAIKLPLTQAVLSPDDRERFLREARSAGEETGAGLNRDPSSASGKLLLSQTLIVGFGSDLKTRTRKRERSSLDQLSSSVLPAAPSLTRSGFP